MNHELNDGNTQMTRNGREKDASGDEMRAAGWEGCRLRRSHDVQSVHSINNSLTHSLTYTCSPSRHPATHHSPPIIHPPSSIIHRHRHRSPSTIHHPSFIIHRLSFTVHRPPSTIHPYTSPMRDRSMSPPPRVSPSCLHCRQRPDPTPHICIYACIHDPFFFSTVTLAHTQNAAS